MFTCPKLPDSNEVSGLFIRLPWRLFVTLMGFKQCIMFVMTKKTLIVALQRNGAKSMYLAFGKLEGYGDLSLFVCNRRGLSK